ncbi:hypothetical protein, partial [Paracoccus sp. (in: a-proteobacteria)]|uniref:hypothetical protein n=1 Tax=Paracoccus sp. TaxID=267 RepID=UPI00396CA4B4
MERLFPDAKYQKALLVTAEAKARINAWVPIASDPDKGATCTAPFPPIRNGEPLMHRYVATDWNGTTWADLHIEPLDFDYAQLRCSSFSGQDLALFKLSFAPAD